MADPGEHYRKVAVEVSNCSQAEANVNDREVTRTCPVALPILTPTFKMTSFAIRGPKSHISMLLDKNSAYRWPEMKAWVLVSSICSLLVLISTVDGFSPPKGGAGSTGFGRAAANGGASRSIRQPRVDTKLFGVGSLGEEPHVKTVLFVECGRYRLCGAKRKTVQCLALTQGNSPYGYTGSFPHHKVSVRTPTDRTLPRLQVRFARVVSLLYGLHLMRCPHCSGLVS
jgi:hypothetical protein